LICKKFYNLLSPHSARPPLRIVRWLVSHCLQQIQSLAVDFFEVLCNGARGAGHHLHTFEVSHKSSFYLDDCNKNYVQYPNSRKTNLLTWYNMAVHYHPVIWIFPIHKVNLYLVPSSQWVATTPQFEWHDWKINWNENIKILCKVFSSEI
jgi:hypothetical protein